MKQKKLSESIRWRFFFLFLATCIGTIAIGLILVSLLLERYYIYKKTQNIKEACDLLNEAAQDGSITSEAFWNGMQVLTERYDIQLLVLDEDALTIHATSSNPDFFSNKLWERLLDTGDKLQGNGLRFNIEYEDRNEKKNSYMFAYGFLENGNVFIMGVPLSSIHESKKLTVSFMFFVGIICIGIGALGAYFGSYWISVRELENKNRELVNKLKLKEEIDNARSEFLSNVSHELKTPIAIIRGYAEGLLEMLSVSDDKKDSTDMSCNEYLGVIINESKRMNDMIRELKSLSAIEDGTEINEAEEFDLCELIQSFIKSADILTRSKDVEVKFLSYEDPLYVIADSFRVEEIIQNYLNNAIEHVLDDKLIEIRIDPPDEGGDCVRVSVHNKGEPIPEDALPHIWEKFYKVDKAHTRKHGGSGLGLSIVKAIQEQAHLGYGVTNYEDGVSFWFELRLKRG